MTKNTQMQSVFWDKTTGEKLSIIEEKIWLPSCVRKSYLENFKSYLSTFNKNSVCCLPLRKWIKSRLQSFFFNYNREILCRTNCLSSVQMATFFFLLFFSEDPKIPNYLIIIVVYQEQKVYCLLISAATAAEPRYRASPWHLNSSKAPLWINSTKWNFKKNPKNENNTLILQRSSFTIYSLITRSVRAEMIVTHVNTTWQTWPSKMVFLLSALSRRILSFFWRTKNIK